MKQITVRPHPKKPWMDIWKLPYNRELTDKLKTMPGVAWDKPTKTWLVPEECFGAACALGDKYWMHATKVGQKRARVAFKTTSMHQYQNTGTLQALINEGRWLFNDEMGLGKTAQAIRAMEAMHKGGRVLIVCPAMVRRAWVKELAKWWPEHPSVGVIEYGTKRTKGLSKATLASKNDAMVADIQIVSYALVDQVDVGPYDCVVFDEIHRLKNDKSKAAGVCKKISNMASKHGGGILGCSATAMPDKPGDVWNLLDTIWPGRFGTAWKFKTRYTNGTHNGYGWKFEGLNPIYASELRERLEACSSRTVKKDVAHLLPPFNVKTIYTPELDRIKCAREWLEDVEATHWCILTHRRELAHELGKALDANVITGELTTNERHQRIEWMRNETTAARVVATIDSIGEGIDLTFFTEVLMAEMHWWVKAMIQVLGRFSRLSGKLPSTVSMLVREGTLDERIAAKMEDNLSDINSTVRAGAAETELEQILDRCESEEESLAKLRVALDVDGEDELMALLEE